MIPNGTETIDFFQEYLEWPFTYRKGGITILIRRNYSPNIVLNWSKKKR